MQLWDLDTVPLYCMDLARIYQWWIAFVAKPVLAVATAGVSATGLMTYCNICKLFVLNVAHDSCCRMCISQGEHNKKAPEAKNL